MIKCFYSCDACGIKRQHVDVPERDPGTHNVVEWLDGVAAPRLILDHHARSPLCRPKTLSEVGIPYDEGTEHVGTKVRS